MGPQKCHYAIDTNQGRKSSCPLLWNKTGNRQRVTDRLLRGSPKFLLLLVFYCPALVLQGSVHLLHWWPAITQYIHYSSLPCMLHVSHISSPFNFITLILFGGEYTNCESPNKEQLFPATSYFISLRLWHVPTFISEAKQLQTSAMSWEVSASIPVISTYPFAGDISSRTPQLPKTIYNITSTLCNLYGWMAI